MAESEELHQERGPATTAVPQVEEPSGSEVAVPPATEPTPTAEPVPVMANAVPPGAPLPPVAYGLQMKRRHPWGVWGLSLLTFGIYYVVWWYKIHHELAEYDPRQGIKPTTSFLAVFIGGFLILPPLITTATAGGRVSRAQRAAGLKASCSGGLGLLLFFCFGLVAVYYQAQLNRVVDRYRTDTGTRVPLYA
jgi:hypothetical protein